VVASPRTYSIPVAMPRTVAGRTDKQAADIQWSSARDGHYGGQSVR